MYYFKKLDDGQSIKKKIVQLTSVMFCSLFWIS